MSNRLVEELSILLLAILAVVLIVVLAGGIAKGELPPPNMQIPNIQPVECGSKKKTPLSDYIGSYVLSNGFELFMYDTNNDTYADARIILHPKDPNRYPIFYSFDLDHRVYEEGKTTPEIVYQDTRRDGSCQGIIIYWTPSIPYFQEVDEGTKR